MFVTDYTMHLLDNVKKIHFIGCGGSGMYPLIQILTAKGYDISGSDVLDGSIIRSEREMGVKVSLGHAADNVIGADLVVYSAAIAKDNVELNAAASYGIPTVERSVLLGYVSRLYKDSICVSGTHGKTTTTSMITTALELAGRDPSAVIGGKLRHQRNAQHLQKHCRALPLKIPVQRAQPVEQRLDLPHNDGKQPRGGADRDEERERGLVLFQEQGQHSRHKHRGGQLAQQHHSS